jgi:F0F1-type ATP synthase assembly protein I
VGRLFSNATMQRDEELDARDLRLQEELRLARRQFQNASETERPEAKRRYLETLRTFVEITSATGGRFAS